MSSIYNFNGIKFTCPDGHLVGQAKVFHRGLPEANDTGLDGHVREMESFIKNTENLKSILDVGACSGLFSVIFTRNQGSRAIAIEPSPFGFPTLTATIAFNPDRHITAINEFVGDVTGRQVQCTKVYVHIIADYGGGDEWHKRWCGKSLEPTHVTLTERRIDDMDIPAIDCLKLDVEAYECQVLRGAKLTIKKNRPVIFLEAHIASLEAHGESADSLLKILLDYGYRIEDFDGLPVTTLNNNSIKRVTCFPI